MDENMAFDMGIIHSRLECALNNFQHSTHLNVREAQTQREVAQEFSQAIASFESPLPFNNPDYMRTIRKILRATYPEFYEEVDKWKKILSDNYSFF